MSGVMDDGAIEPDEQDYADAMTAVEAWDRDEGRVTGYWIDRYGRMVNVGIASGDEIALTAELQERVPPSIRVRTRPATEQVVRLRRFQREVDDFLHDEGIWGTWAVHLGPDGSETAVEVGLLPGTPADVVQRIRDRFAGMTLVVRLDARHAIAL